MEYLLINSLFSSLADPLISWVIKNRDVSSSDNLTFDNKPPYNSLIRIKNKSWSRIVPSGTQASIFVIFKTFFVTIFIDRDNITFFSNLLNYMPHAPMCLTCFRAFLSYAPLCLTCLRAFARYVPHAPYLRVLLTVFTRLTHFNCAALNFFRINL